MYHEFTQLFTGTLVLGSLYALVAIGFVILFRSTGVINFAQGSFMVLAAYLFYSLVTSGRQPFWSAFLVTLAALGGLGGAVYAGLFRRLVGSELFVVVIASLGLSVAIETAILLIWGPQFRSLPQMVSIRPLFAPFGISFSSLDLLSIGLAVGFIGALELGLQRTVLGIRTRAVADSALLAALTRVDVHLVSGLAWATAAVCAAAAGVAVALRSAVDPTSIAALGLLTFPAVIIGGVDSMRGAMVGGLLVALLQNLTLVVLGGAWVDPVAYAVLLLMLLIRPRGLFGSRQIVRL